MNIVFNLIIAGCGNNGGTRTVLLSAQALESLGHRCDVVARVDNFTWFPHKAVINHIPNDTDVIINASAADYEVTRRSNVPKKYAWWRGHEKWAVNENKIIEYYRDAEVKNLVNSNGLKHLLKTYDADSQVIYQGVDIDSWTDLNIRSNKKIRIGCLYNTMKTKRWEDFLELSDKLGTEYEYVAIGNKPYNAEFLTEYLHRPPHEELNRLYSSCNIWLAPTVSEGLHNPPMEAALCSVLIVCSDCITNGMVLDYASPTTAMIYSNIDEAVELIKNPNWSLINNMQDQIKNKIGTRKQNMIKLINLINNGDIN